MRARLIDLAISLVLMLGSLGLYHHAGGQAQMCDSCYALATSQALVQDGTVALDRHLPPDRTRLPGYDPARGRPYHLEPSRIGLCYCYPLGSSLLSAPLVALWTHTARWSAFDERGTYALEGETALELRTASLVTACAVGVWYRLAREFVGPAPAAGLAATLAAGSMAFSTMARALWSHTWAALLVSLAILVALRLEREPGVREAPRAIMLGTLAFWTHLARPQAFPGVAALVLALAFRRRRAGAIATATAAAWIVAGAAASLAAFGTPRPPSAYDRLVRCSAPLSTVAAFLVSPSRGLLVLCPYVPVIGAVLVARRRILPEPWLLVPGALEVAAILASGAIWETSLGGHSFGPRYFTDALPWFAVAGAQALAVLPGPRTGALLAACAAFGVFVHARGACRVETWWWNAGCEVPAIALRRANDWRHPQCLAGLAFGVRPDGRFEDQP